MAKAHKTITLFVTDFPFRSADTERLRAALGEQALYTVRGESALVETLKAHPETDALCTLTPSDDLHALAPRLQWLALASAGADHVLRQSWTNAPNAPQHITTANGVHAIPISEHVFSAMLLWSRHWPEMLKLQARREWPDEHGKQALAGRELAGATLLVVGLGAIGRRIAQLGRAFGMRVIATRRAATRNDPDVDALMPMDALNEALAQADYVALAVPSTPETYHLIGAEQLAAMKPGALLINIARGEVVDEAALIAALKRGPMGGAALDVTEQEPLPQSSPLWKMPNVLISPHVSGRTAHYSKRLTDLLLANIAAYREGRPLRNSVDIARGY